LKPKYRKMLETLLRPMRMRLLDQLLETKQKAARKAWQTMIQQLSLRTSREILLGKWWETLLLAQMSPPSTRFLQTSLPPSQRLAQPTTAPRVVILDESDSKSKNPLLLLLIKVKVTAHQKVTTYNQVPPRAQGPTKPLL
jgi:hypothetical protein